MAYLRKYPSIHVTLSWIVTLCSDVFKFHIRALPEGTEETCGKPVRITGPRGKVSPQTLSNMTEE